MHDDSLGLPVANLHAGARGRYRHSLVKPKAKFSTKIFPAGINYSCTLPILFKHDTLMKVQALMCKLLASESLVFLRAGIFKI